jgi:hypothetical protein
MEQQHKLIYAFRLHYVEPNNCHSKVQGFNLAIRNKQEQLKLRMHHSQYMGVEETDARATGEVKRRSVVLPTAVEMKSEERAEWT